MSCEVDLSSLQWDYARPRTDRSCRSTRSHSTGAVSASAASAVHTPQSIDKELARLTKDLELRPAGISSDVNFSCSGAFLQQSRVLRLQLKRDRKTKRSLYRNRNVSLL